MRAGFTVSLVGHAAILGFGLVAFAGTRPLEAEKVDALPVELVSLAEETDLLQGNKTSKILPEDNPQPAPDLKAETPKPIPAEKPAETPVEATEAPPPPAPEPEPEPDSEPEKEVAALPDPPPEPEPEPEPAPAPEVQPEPAPQQPVEAPVPKPRPAPPKKVEAPKQPDKPREAPKKEEKFNADDIAALLNKQEAKGGTPAPAQEPQTLGSVEGHTGAAMTQSEIAALKARLYRCWNPPVAVREAGSLVVEIRITLLPDGSLSGDPELIGVTNVSDPLSQIAAEAAIRAVRQCAPFGDILRPETYALWNQIDFVFDPREMLGG